MQKKIISIIVAIFTLLCCITAFADNSLEKEVENATYSRISNIIETYISKASNLKKPETFDTIINCYDKAKVENIRAYLKFIYNGRFTYSELQVINRILENGTTIQSLQEVYDFWLTTDEDFGMIENICQLEDSYFSEYWFESAFNELTDYTHGELDGTQVLKYIAQGVSLDEILAANVMSRKSGQNIVSLLDSHLQGVSLESSALDIYGVSSLGEYTSLHTAITEIAKNARRPREYGLLISGSNVENMISTFVNTKFMQELSRLGLEVPTDDIQSDYSNLQNSGYPINVQRTLLNKGFTPDEIIKSADYHSQNLRNAIKTAREMLKNEK